MKKNIIKRRKRVVAPVNTPNYQQNLQPHVHAAMAHAHVGNGDTVMQDADNARNAPPAIDFTGAFRGTKAQGDQNVAGNMNLISTLTEDFNRELANMFMTKKRTSTMAFEGEDAHSANARMQALAALLPGAQRVATSPGGTPQFEVPIEPSLLAMSHTLNIPENALPKTKKEILLAKRIFYEKEAIRFQSLAEQCQKEMNEIPDEDGNQQQQGQQQQQQQQLEQGNGQDGQQQQQQQQQQQSPSNGVEGGTAAGQAGSSNGDTGAASTTSEQTFTSADVMDST